MSRRDGATPRSRSRSSPPRARSSTTRSRWSRRGRRSGSIGILANHQPLLAMLDPTELRLYRARVRRRALRPGRGLPAGRRQQGARARRGGASRPTSSTPPSCATACATRRGGCRGGRARTPRSSAARARQAPLRGVPQGRRGRLRTDAQSSRLQPVLGRRTLQLVQPEAVDRAAARRCPAGPPRERHARRPRRRNAAVRSYPFGPVEAHGAELRAGPASNAARRRSSVRRRARAPASGPPVEPVTSCPVSDLQAACARPGSSSRAEAARGEGLHRSSRPGRTGPR